MDLKTVKKFAGKKREISKLKSEYSEEFENHLKSKKEEAETPEQLSPVERLDAVVKRIDNLSPNMGYNPRLESTGHGGYYREKWLNEYITGRRSDRLSVSVHAIYDADPTNSYGLRDLIEVNATWYDDNTELGTEVVTANKVREVSERQAHGWGTSGQDEMMANLTLLEETLGAIEAQRAGQAVEVA